MSQFYPSGGQKYWSFSFSISPSNEYSGLILFRIDWFDFLAIQGTLKSLLQYHSSKASILWSSTFFRVQLSHQYMTTGKTIALTGRTFFGKVISLLFNLLPHDNCSFNFYFILKLIYNVVLTSGVQQNNLVIHISILLLYRLLQITQ